MGLTLGARGAAVEQVVLNEFTRAVDSDEPYVFQRPAFATGDNTRSLVTRAAVVDGTRVELDNVAWSLESSSSTSATYSITIEGDAGPLVRIRKTYEMFDRSAAGAGYELAVAHGVENLSGGAHEVKLIFNGPITPPREVDRGPDRYAVGGYDRQGVVRVNHHAIEEFAKEKASIDMTRHEDQPLRWIGAVSVYFAGIARPVDGADAKLARVEAVAFNPEAPPYERDAGLVFESSPLQVAPAQTSALPLRVFFGPRQRSLLKSDYYAALGYNEVLVLTGGPCAYCTFQWLIDVLVVLLRAFHWVFGGFASKGDWGLAIIALVVLVRLLLHPVTKKSQVSMMRMSKFGPELERLRKKYGDNKDELNKAMMGFYKEQGFSPVLGCLPMFLQMPIWIALWSALNSTFELRHAPFLWGYTWIDDLAKPDHLLRFSRPYHLWFLYIDGLNLLPILMGVVFYLQMKLQPKPISMTKEQEQQQKIMQWMMPFLFPVMLYSGPSGLNLYIMTSTLIGIWESKRIRDHIKQQEEAEAQQRVIIDAKPTRAQKDSTKKRATTEEPKRGIAGWLAGLQDRAEQIRREAERKGK
jgi:YidC/Oxa1 family membrane protein insertase